MLHLASSRGCWLRHYDVEYFRLLSQITGYEGNRAASRGDRVIYFRRIITCFSQTLRLVFRIVNVQFRVNLLVGYQTRAILVSRLRFYRELCSRRRKRERIYHF
ncbi:hypothetical protein PUN28_003273 [Cardiocondyla obscurior]|uniref:Uncharacterized protein n=1 Tax=Cardiocondyla obscurior TaxID=286306 RepID=A0AAW2GJN9_9HYME